MRLEGRSDATADAAQKSGNGERITPDRLGRGMYDRLHLFDGLVPRQF